MERGRKRYRERERGGKKDVEREKGGREGEREEERRREGKGWRERAGKVPCSCISAVADTSVLKIVCVCD